MPLPTIVSDEEGGGLGALTRHPPAGQERGNWKLEKRKLEAKGSGIRCTHTVHQLRAGNWRELGKKERIGKKENLRQKGWGIRCTHSPPTSWKLGNGQEIGKLEKRKL